MKTRIHSNTSVQLVDVVKPRWLSIFGPILLTLCATLLWRVSLQEIDIRRMNDLGLVSVLPLSMFIALLMVIISFCLTLHQRQLRMPVLLLHIVVIVFMLYGTTTLVEEGPRFAVAWRHVGISEYVVENGSIDPKIDAYFNWPGFFILSAFVTEIAGFQTAMSLVPWASVYFNLLYLGPLLTILSSGTSDKRLIWLGVWFFYLTNWIGQDYFAPQALIYFLYLVILGILVKWFKVMATKSNPLHIRLRGFDLRLPNKIYGWLTPISTPNEPSQPIQQVGLLSIIIILFIAAVPSHQLTPFAILGSATALIILNRCIPRGLPIIMGIVIVAWIIFMATTYLDGHFASLTKDAGQVNTLVAANVGERLKGSAQHLFIVYIRLVMTIAIWGLAFLGGIRRLRNGYWDLNHALLATAPFLFVVLQPYGGEMLLRAYLFVLPAMVFFAAALFYTTPRINTSWRITATIGLVSAALTGGLLFARYGNERMDAFTLEEVAAVQHLYSVAEPGSLLVAGSENLPWKFQDYEKHKYRTVADQILAGDIDAIAHLMREKKYNGAYLILTRSNKAYAELFEGLPPGSWERFEKDLIASGQFKLIFANDDSKIFILANGGDGVQP